MFTSISQQSPPLSLYPKAQRVTFLYYLGRYMFANSHFYRAVQTLEEAYSQCHSTMLKHRRLILIHLIASNMILGRNPSSHLFNRREAQGLQQIFGPIITAISKGNIQSFRSLTSLDGDSPIAEWLLQKRLLLQIRNRCEILVWRSLARKIFLIDGFHGDGSNKMPTFSLKTFQHAATFLENNAAAEPLSTISGNAARGPTGLSNSLPKSPTSPIPKLHALYPGYIAMELDGIKHNDQEQYTPAPQLIEIESVFSSLMHQKLMNGQLVRGENPRFGISGAKGTVKGALKIGWPSVWDTLKAKAEEDGSGVPGWVLAPGEEATPTAGSLGGGGPGGVVNLSGVRPVGGNPFAGGLGGGNPFSGGNLAGGNPFVRRR
jgi:nuclear mRNA export protein PCID2/THP1